MQYAEKVVVGARKHIGGAVADCAGVNPDKSQMLGGNRMPDKPGQPGQRRHHIRSRLTILPVVARQISACRNHRLFGVFKGGGILRRLVQRHTAKVDGVMPTGAGGQVLSVPQRRYHIAVGAPVRIAAMRQQFPGQRAVNFKGRGARAAKDNAGIGGQFFGGGYIRAGGKVGADALNRIAVNPFVRFRTVVKTDDGYIDISPVQQPFPVGVRHKYAAAIIDAFQHAPTEFSPDILRCQQAGPAGFAGGDLTARPLKPVAAQIG